MAENSRLGRAHPAAMLNTATNANAGTTKRSRLLGLSYIGYPTGRIDSDTTDRRLFDIARRSLFCLPRAIAIGVPLVSQVSAAISGPAVALVSRGACGPGKGTSDRTA
jgi:hypothetical protein